MRLATILAFALFGAVPAAAKPGATARYRHAMRLYRAHQYSAAINEYERALAAGGDRVILYDIAQAHRLAGHDAQAMNFYRLFLRTAPLSPLRFSAKTEIARLRARIAAHPRRIAAARTTPPTAPAAPDPRVEPTTAATAAPAPPVGAAAAPDEEFGIDVVGPPPETEPPPDSTAADEPAAPAGAVLTIAMAAPREPSDAAQEKGVEPPAVTTLPLVPVEPAVAAPAPARAVDVLQTSGAALVLGGAVLIGSGIGCGGAAAFRSYQVEQSVRFDPELESSGQRFQTAAVVLSVVGAAAMLAGGELIRRHVARSRARRGATAPSATLRTAGLGISF